MKFKFLVLLMLIVYPITHAHAATITTGPNCAFADAIYSGEFDIATNGCSAGSGIDTISLGQDETIEYGVHPIASPLIIEGNNHVIIFKNTTPDPARLFTLSLGGNLKIYNTYFKYLPGTGPEIEYGGFAFLESAPIELDNVVVDGFRAQLFGGAILSDSNVYISSSTFSKNVQTNAGSLLGGGAIGGSKVFIDESQFFGNEAHGQGGVILFSGGQMTITKSVFHGNSANDGSVISATSWNAGTDISIDESEFTSNSSDNGGAIVWQGSLGQIRINNSLFSENNAGVGGALTVAGPGKIIIVNNTFSGNTASDTGSAIYNNSSSVATLLIAYNTFTGNTSQNSFGTFSSGQFSSWFNSALENNIFYSNIGGDCNLPTLTGLSMINNLSDDGTCGGSVATGVDTSLANNGGPTKTHALILGSNAIDAAETNGQFVKIKCPTRDQRNIFRPFDGDGDGFAKCDIGAFEFKRRLGELPGTAKIEKPVEEKPTIKMTESKDAKSTEAAS